MNPIVFAGFMLGGWNLASAYSVGKDTQSGKMPGPKSFGYTLAALLGVTGATLGYYSMKAQENPKLLAAERMHGDDRLDRWVEESYGDDYDWVLLGQEQDHDVHEILDDFIVLDDEGNEYEGIAITYRSEGKSWQGISLAGTVDEIDEMLGRKKEAETFGAESLSKDERVKMGRRIVDDFNRTFGTDYKYGLYPSEGYSKIRMYGNWNNDEGFGIYTELDGMPLKNWKWMSQKRDSDGDILKGKYERNERYDQWKQRIQKEYPMFDFMKISRYYHRSDEPTSLELTLYFTYQPSKNAETIEYDPKHYNDLLAGKVNSEIKESMREEGWPEDEINLMYAIPHSSYAGFIPEVQARELFDEIHKFNDPANQELYESESQTFEAPTPYTNADQEAFTKSYSRKAKNPWSKVTRNVSFKRLGKAGRYSGRNSVFRIPSANVTAVGGQEEAISLIEQYTMMATYARHVWLSRVSKGQGLSNDPEKISKYQGMMAQKALLPQIRNMEAMSKLPNIDVATHYETVFTAANIREERWVDELEERFTQLRRAIALSKAMQGPMKNIKCIGSNYAPVENDGGYGRTNYHTRNPYPEGDNIFNSSWEKDPNTEDLILKDGNYYNNALATYYAVLDKMRFYEGTPPTKEIISSGSSITLPSTSFQTDGGYSWSTTSYFSQLLAITDNTMTQSNYGAMRREPVRIDYSSGNTISGKQYDNALAWDIEDWETDRTPNYLLGTLVPLGKMPYIETFSIEAMEALKDELNKAKNKLAKKAADKKAKEEADTATRQKRQAQTDAINAFYEVNGKIDRMIKRRVKAAAEAGLDPADIATFLEDLQADLEEFMADLDMDEYLKEE